MPNEFCSCCSFSSCCRCSCCCSSCWFCCFSFSSYKFLSDLRGCKEGPLFLSLLGIVLLFFVLLEVVEVVEVVEDVEDIEEIEDIESEESGGEENKADCLFNFLLVLSVVEGLLMSMEEVRENG